MGLVAIVNEVVCLAVAECADGLQQGVQGRGGVRLEAAGLKYLAGAQAHVQDQFAVDSGQAAAQECPLPWTEAEGVWARRKKVLAAI
jgi:hypothetical protein